MCPRSLRNSRRVGEQRRACCCPSIGAHFQRLAAPLRPSIRRRRRPRRSHRPRALFAMTKHRRNGSRGARPITRGSSSRRASAANLTSCRRSSVKRVATLPATRVATGVAIDERRVHRRAARRAAHNAQGHRTPPTRSSGRCTSGPPRWTPYARRPVGESPTDIPVALTARFWAVRLISTRKAGVLVLAPPGARSRGFEIDGG